MKDRPDSERVEIELDPNVDGRHRRRHRDPDPAAEWGPAAPAESEVVVSAPVDDGTAPGGDGPRRMFVVVAVVGVLALVLGWLIGRSGGSGEVVTLGVTVPATTEPEQTELLPGDTLPSAATTTTRPPRTTTTSTLVPAIVESVVVDPRLAGVELTLVGIERNTAIAELDLAAQTLTRRELAGIGSESAILVGDDWVVVGNLTGGRPWLVGDDGTRQRVGLGEPWELLWQVGTDRFWHSTNEWGWGGSPFEQPVYEEVDVTGEPTGRTLELPPGAWSWQTDPGGGLLVEQVGKLYSVDESSIELIGAGELIALSADLAVMRDCDEQLRCGLFVTDRLTGQVRRLPVDDERRPLEGLYGWIPPAAHSIAPDGSVCAVVLPGEDGDVLALLDLGSGAVVELGETGFPTTVVWSPDARFAFFVAGFEGFDGFDDSGSGGVTAYDLRTGELFPVLPDGLHWRAVAARPT